MIGIANANDDWARANSEATRCIEAMAIIPRTGPLFAKLEAALEDASERRRDAGDRISSLSQKLLDARREIQP